jgi:hypothetical protein
MRRSLLALILLLLAFIPAAVQAAAAFADLETIANDPAFRKRVDFAMTQAAIAIYNEGTGVTGHQARAAYAIQVLRGAYNNQQATVAVLTSATIIAEALVGQPTATPSYAIPDADIASSVSAVWNSLAGV